MYAPLASHRYSVETLPHQLKPMIRYTQRAAFSQDVTSTKAEVEISSIHGNQPKSFLINKFLGSPFYALGKKKCVL